MNTHSFSQAGQMIELCCEYLSERRIWVYVITMSCTRFRENYHSIVAWMSMNSLLETDRMYDVMASVWSKEFLDIQATIKCRFTLKRVLIMIINTVKCILQISTHNTALSLGKWLSVCLRTKWLWVRILLLSLKLRISCLFWARSYLAFRQL